MGLFNLFSKPFLLQHEYFGSLRFIDSKDPSKCYFEGKGHFAPTNSETEYFIAADKSGPTSGQQQFYEELQKNFSHYLAKIIPLIEDEFRNWKPDFSIRDFSKEFSLVVVTIPRTDIQPLIWDLAFTTIHDLNHHLQIDFKGDEPTGILIDG